MQYTHDMIIVGAGIVGSTMALAAAKNGLSVALLDKHAPNPITKTTHLRVSNINYQSEQFLNHFGVTFPKDRCGIFKKIKLTQQDSAHSLSFQADLLNLPYLGTIIENDVLIAAIQSTFNHQVNTHWQADIQQLQINDEGVRLTLNDHTELCAPLIIGAEGAHSYVRAHCGIVVDEKSYEQVALVAHIQTEHPHHQTAYQRFLTSGPLAYLPLANLHQCSIVWSSAPEHIQTLMALNDEQLAHEIAHQMQHELGSVQLISQRACFPLVMRHARSYIAQRVALIGDAIHTVHPLAGQGANLGMMDVACLAKHLSWAKTQRRDWGSVALLRRFERERRFANTMMLHTITLLAQNQPPFSGLRRLGMNLLERSALLKKIVMQFAQGV